MHGVEKKYADQTPSAVANTDKSPSSLHHETTHHDISQKGDNDVDYPNGKVTVKHRYCNHKNFMVYWFL